MKAYENTMKNFHKSMKANEKNKVLMYRDVPIFARFHAYILDLSDFKKAQNACRAGAKGLQ